MRMGKKYFWSNYTIGQQGTKAQIVLGIFDCYMPIFATIHAYLS